MFSTSSGQKSKTTVIAIAREYSANLESRAVLSPEHVKELCKNGVKVLVQPCDLRAYPVKAYKDAGAAIQEDLEEASLILGVREIPYDNLLPNKTYCFLTHTLKAKEKLLNCLIERKIRLIDYEVLFKRASTGKYAGYAGAVNILSGLGLRLLTLGHRTPFLRIGVAHNYKNTESAKQAVKEVGCEIAQGVMPKSVGPLTFLITGTGEVSVGVQEILVELPHEYVSPSKLFEFAENASLDKIYVSVFKIEDNLKRKDGGEFDLEEYNNHPDKYCSVFSEEFAPYASVIVNCIAWTAGQPRLLTIADGKKLLQPSSPGSSNPGSPPLPNRLLGICDISASVEGSVEFMTQCTTIDAPFALYDEELQIQKERFTGHGVLICSINNMPAQLGTDSTDYFGSLLYPHIDPLAPATILVSDATKPLDEDDLDPVVREAVVVSNGKLTTKFEYIAENLKKKRKKSASV